MAILDIDNNIYAKVENGKIVEYPIYSNHIRNRSHPVDWYTLCVFDAKPQITKYQYLTEDYEILDNLIKVHYVIKDMTLKEVLNLFKDPASDIMMPSPLPISSLTAEDIAKVQELASIEVQNLLDEFARTRGYDDIKSAVTYLNSTNTVYSTEATTAMNLRDNCWSALETYLTDVQAGTKPVPLTVEEIISVLPPLVW